MAMGSNFKSFIARLLAGAIADVTKSGWVVTLLSVLSLFVAVISLQVAVAQLKAGQAPSAAAAPQSSEPKSPTVGVEPRLDVLDCACPGADCPLNNAPGRLILVRRQAAPHAVTCIGDGMDGLLWRGAEPLNAPPKRPTTTLHRHSVRQIL